MSDFSRKLFKKTGIEEYDSCEAVVAEMDYNGCFACVTGPEGAA